MGSLKNWWDDLGRDRKERKAWNLQDSAWGYDWIKGQTDHAKSAALYVRSAELYAEINENQKAARSYHLAGEQENELGNHAKANRRFEQAIQLNPELAPAYRDLAINHAGGRGVNADHARAAELFETAAELLSRQDSGHRECAACCLRAAEQESLLGHSAEAEKWRKKGEAMNKEADRLQSTFVIPKIEE